MKHPILIPEAHSYGIAILVLNGLGASTVAVHVHSRWLARMGVPFMLVYCSAMGVVVVWGLLVLDFSSIVGTPCSWVISIPLGLFVGRLARWSDCALLRCMASQQPGRQARHTKNPPASDISASVFHPEPVLVGEGGDVRRAVGRYWSRHQYESLPQEYQFGFCSMVTVAILEEVLHRGLLLHVCLLLSDTAWISTLR